MENNKRKIYVIGHKNPDTDSICSAIAYADIKNRTEGKGGIIEKNVNFFERSSFILVKGIKNLVYCGGISLAAKLTAARSGRKRRRKQQ